MSLCLFVLTLLTLCRDAYSNISEDMSSAIQQCCNAGTIYANKHPMDSCSDNQVIPSGMRTEFGPLCAIARTQCCDEYFQKKQDCETGIDIATSSRHCQSLKASAKVCCNECVIGLTMGTMNGYKLCSSRPPGTTPEQLLSDEAYERCCKKTAKEKPMNSPKISSNSVTTSTKSNSVASKCEDFAPNELCAHHCIPVPGSYKCECNPGFKLMADRRNCIEVVKNRCKPRNPCQHKCNDNGVEVMCSCRRGYELMPDGKSCQDIDECILDMQICLPETQCYNIQGSYKCIPNKKHRNKVERGNCPPGFKKNAVNHGCDDINECKLPSPPCPSYLCENTIGAYKCGGVTGDPVNLSSTPRIPVEERCPLGFKLGPKGDCDDVDECAIHKDDCNLLSQFCINTHGSFYCQNQSSRQCPPGFKIDYSTGKCEDIDECEDVSDLCRQDQICVNQLGKYDCKLKADESTPSSTICPDGMRMNSGVCEDIDECAEGTHICDITTQRCLNTNGSYDCHCIFGYELDAQTGACIDMNECATGQHNCIPGSQRCDNTVGSYLCIRITPCGTGYILHHSTGNCEDIDECALGTHNCAVAGPEYQCMNLLGSFRCIRRRATVLTTSTTPSPVVTYGDEDYYYTYEEILVGNQTVPETVPPKTIDISLSPSNITTTTTTVTSVSSSENPTTLSSTIEPTTQKLLETRPDDTINYIIPSTNKDTNTESNIIPKGDENEIIPYPGTSPKITFIEHNTESEVKYEVKDYKDLPTTPEEPIITYSEPKTDQNNKEFDPSIPEYVPYVPETSNYPSEPTTTTSESKKYETSQTTVHVPDENEIPNTLDFIPLQTDRTDMTYQPENPGKTSPKDPQSVYENVDKNTEAAITEEIDKPGPETVNVNKVDMKTCPFGFENDEYGACFDIDECATNRHSCSGLTETCRNTMGGYLCDCTTGFRRDQSTGVCDIINTPHKTPIKSFNKPPIKPFTEASTKSSINSTTSSVTSPTTSTTLVLTTPTSTTTSTSEKSRSFFWGYPDYRPITTRPFRQRNMCDTGYHLNSLTGICEDVDECTNGQASCAEVELCVNTEGGFRCECPPNWRLDDIRHRCMPIRDNGTFPPGYKNEPSYPTQTSVEVSVGVKGGNNYVTPRITQVHDHVSIINCQWGYRLADDHTCQDVDECLTGQAKCGPLQLCTNLPGGYSCSCPKGHRLVEDHDCQDVDECALAKNMPICSKNADCVNTIGSYKCSCHKGYRSAPINDKVCVNVDECAESRSGTLCQHRCNDVWGGYRCSCHRGYKLNPDNSTCSDVDECMEFKSNNLCVGRCLNLPGSYRCSCPSGYRLAEDKRSCIDIDECSNGEATCGKSGVFGDTSHICFNTRGSYKCHRITCPMGYRLEGKHRCNKVDRVCRPGDWNCVHQATTISYNFITFVSKLYIPDQVKLFTMRGPSWSQARLKFQLLLADVNAPPSVKVKADSSAFLLEQFNNEAVISLVRSLDGPQSIDLELSMELYNGNEFGGTAIARLFIYISEYEY